jgi:hypothetical protein
LKNLLFALFVLGSLVSQAQTNLDSLYGVWNDKTQPDTSRLKAMHDIAWDGYLFSQPDSAFYFAQMQYDLAEKSALKKQMAGALNTQGISFAIRGNYPKALDLLPKELKDQGGNWRKKRNRFVPERYRELLSETGGSSTSDQPMQQGLATGTGDWEYQ